MGKSATIRVAAVVAPCIRLKAEQPVQTKMAQEHPLLREVLFSTTLWVALEAMAVIMTIFQLLLTVGLAGLAEVMHRQMRRTTTMAEVAVVDTLAVAVGPTTTVFNIFKEAAAVAVRSWLRLPRMPLRLMLLVTPKMAMTAQYY
jgi:hypothetical protein